MANGWMTRGRAAPTRPRRKGRGVAVGLCVAAAVTATAAPSARAGSRRVTAVTNCVPDKVLRQQVNPPQDPPFGPITAWVEPLVRRYAYGLEVTAFDDEAVAVRCQISNYPNPASIDGVRLHVRVGENEVSSHAKACRAGALGGGYSCSVAYFPQASGFTELNLQPPPGGWGQGYPMITTVLGNGDHLLGAVYDY